MPVVFTIDGNRAFVTHNAQFSQFALEVKSQPIDNASFADSPFLSGGDVAVHTPT